MPEYNMALVLDKKVIGNIKSPVIPRIDECINFKDVLYLVIQVLYEIDENSTVSRVGIGIKSMK